MATGHDEKYARDLYNQSLESEILRGISEFPVGMDDPDAFLAWQLQNQEFKGIKEKNSIPIHQLNTRSFSAGAEKSRAKPESNHKSTREDKYETNEVKRGHLIIIDSDSEDEAPKVVCQETAKLRENTGSNTGRNPEENFMEQMRKKKMEKSSSNGVTKSGALLALSKGEKRETDGLKALTFCSDDLDEDSIPQVTEGSSLPQTQRKSAFGANEHEYQKNADQNPELNKPLNRRQKEKRLKFGKRLKQNADSIGTENGAQINIHQDLDFHEQRPENSQNRNRETRNEYLFPESSNSIPNHVEKNLRQARNRISPNRPQVDTDESVACQLLHRLNKSQVRRDEEYAQRC